MKTTINLYIAVFLIYDGDGRGQMESSVRGALQELGSKFVMSSHNYQSAAHITPAKLFHNIPKGPYFYSPQTGEIYQAFRLYSDHQLAFTEAALSDGAGAFRPLPATISASKVEASLKRHLLIT